MFHTVKFDRARLIFALVLLACIFATVLFLSRADDSVESFAAAGPHTLIIDPGHGGVDGGALAGDGTKESDINLAVGLRMNALAQLFGVKTLMTRVDDSWRTDYASYSEHEDLVYRTELANTAANGVLISIHQNCFPTPQPHGAQVMYSSLPESELLGKMVQNNLVSYTDPENRRLAEPAPKALYITANAKCPTILVECGFMSNSDDVSKLRSPDYQSAIAAVLLASFLQYSIQI